MFEVACAQQARIIQVFTQLDRGKCGLSCSQQALHTAVVAVQDLSLAFRSAALKHGTVCHVSSAVQAKESVRNSTGGRQRSYGTPHGRV
jgi:hypothetical protein